MITNIYTAIPKIPAMEKFKKLKNSNRDIIKLIYRLEKETNKYMTKPEHCKQYVDLANELFGDEDNFKKLKKLLGELSTLNFRSNYLVPEIFSLIRSIRSIAFSIQTGDCITYDLITTETGNWSTDLLSSQINKNRTKLLVKRIRPAQLEDQEEDLEEDQEEDKGRGKTKRRKRRKEPKKKKLKTKKKIDFKKLRKHITQRLKPRFKFRRSKTRSKK